MKTISLKILKNSINIGGFKIMKNKIKYVNGYYVYDLDGVINWLSFNYYIEDIKYIAYQNMLLKTRKNLKLFKPNNVIE